MTLEVQRAIENVWDHRNIHLGDVRIPCDGEVIKNYIETAEKEIERLRNGIRKEWFFKRKAFGASKHLTRQIDADAYRLIFGEEFTGEFTEEVLKRIYGRWWR